MQTINWNGLSRLAGVELRGWEDLQEYFAGGYQREVVLPTGTPTLVGQESCGPGTGYWEPIFILIGEISRLKGALVKLLDVKLASSLGLYSLFEEGEFFGLGEDATALLDHLCGQDKLLQDDVATYTRPATLTQGTIFYQTALQERLYTSGLLLGLPSGKETYLTIRLIAKLDEWLLQVGKLTFGTKNPSAPRDIARD